MESLLVSIILPCYNGEKYIARCIDSIINQTYKNIELIIVNDGSTDNSEKIVFSYKSQLQNSGIKLVYIYQENKGLAGAINAGLKVFSGEFLCWIDYDDYLLPNSILHRMEFLKNNTDIAVVTSDAYSCAETDLEHPIKKISDGKPDLYNPHQFENHLRSRAIFCPGCHMVRSTAFLTVNPNRHIYPCRRGQNWQMLLPIYYRYNQAFLNEPLYVYVVRNESMSRGDDTKEKLSYRYEEHLDIIKHTLADIEMSDKERKKWLAVYMCTYYRQYFYLGVSFHDYPMLLKNMFLMIKSGEWKKEDTIWFKNLIFRKNKKVKEENNA